MSWFHSFARLLAVAAVAALPALAAQAQQKLVPARSQIAFVSKQMGVPVEGQFRKFDAQIAFQPKAPETSKIAFTVDMGSATMGTREVDAELPKPTWFNAPKFPQASFQSTAVKALGGGRYEVTGQLAIKGVAQAVVVPVQLTQSGAVTTAVGSFVVKRLVFRIGEDEWADTSLVANDVQVKFKLALTGVGKL